MHTTFIGKISRKFEAVWLFDVEVFDRIVQTTLGSERNK